MTNMGHTSRVLLALDRLTMQAGAEEVELDRAWRQRCVGKYLAMRAVMQRQGALNVTLTWCG